MSQPFKVVAFKLDTLLLALALHAVERVIPMQSVTILPGMPSGVLGVIDVHGQLVPIFDLRGRLGLAHRKVHLNDLIILVHTTRYLVGIYADSVEIVTSYPAEQRVETGAHVPTLPCITSLIHLQDGLILIPDLDEFLSLSEELALDTAMKRQSCGSPTIN
ncbi:chemotaxis protein CheW [Chitinimonas sp.]|uniref:chemotaxis protein CheW n=1 Tax=Chitinimonas sp. TaxID=1934313 RepID=UPI002F92B52A